MVERLLADLKGTRSAAGEDPPQRVFELRTLGTLCISITHVSN